MKNSSVNQPVAYDRYNYIIYHISVAITFGNCLQHYLDAAEQDRERYMRELQAYKQTEAYKIFTQKQSEKKQREDKQVEAAVQPEEVKQW